MRINVMANMVKYKLTEYIEIFYKGSQKKFAEAQGVKPAQVTQWLKNEFVVIDKNLYSHRRELKTVPSEMATFSNKANILRHAVLSMENILIYGGVRTGKSLLLDFIKSANNNYSILITPNRTPHDITPEEFYAFFKKTVNDCPEKTMILIEDLSHLFFLGDDKYEYLSKLVQIIKESSELSVSFCLVAPPIIDFDEKQKINEIFPNQYMTVRNIGDVQSELESNTFTLQEILELMKD